MSSFEARDGTLTDTLTFEIDLIAAERPSAEHTQETPDTEPAEE